MIRLLFTTGNGPAECRMALAHVLDLLRKDAEVSGLRCDIASARDDDGHGPGFALAMLDDDDLARKWIGGMVWICRSPLRPNHPRKNWFVAAFQLPPAKPPSTLDPRDVRFEALRAGGPGGQHQNKTESAIRAVHRPSGASVVVREERSQHRNKALALARLEVMIAARDELARLRDNAAIYAKHRELQRGGAARRFKGPDFTPA